MDIVVDLVKTYFEERRAVFGKRSKFIRFESNDKRLVLIGNVRFHLIRGYIVYEVQDKHETSEELLVKYFDSKLQYVSGTFGFVIFGREMAFYKGVLPSFQQMRSIRHLIPEMHASCSSSMMGSHKVATVFGGLCNAFHLVDGYTFLGYQHLKLMACKIGEFHGYTFNYQKGHSTFPPIAQNLRLAPSDYNPILPVLNRSLASLVEEYVNVASPSSQFVDGVNRLRELISNFGDRLNAPFVRKGKSEGCWVLCHQNYGQQSVVFEYSEELQPVGMQILNWHSVGMASLGVDLVVLLFVEASEETRTMHLNDLLTDYGKAMKKAFSDIVVPSVEWILGEIKKCIPFALYTLALRVLETASQTTNQLACSMVSSWNERLITQLYVYLIRKQFI